jgi:cytidylate kinase
MSYDLITYFNRKFANLYPQTPKQKQGPFITISRQTGCNANVVAEMLLEELRKQTPEWKMINKEIIDQAAGKLKVDKQRINDIITAKDRTMADEILNALSTRYYKNDKMVRKAIAEVVHHDAESGNVIIVGRGGVAVTRELEKGIHIKLTAPVEWRVNEIMHRRGISKEESEAFVVATDKKRIKLLEQLSGKKSEDILFDLIFNSATFSPPQIVNLILHALKEKQLIN